MTKKRIEDKFSIEMDAYFNGIKEDNKLESKEYNEIFELGKNLADKDFSKNSNKKAMYNKVLENVNKFNGENFMKKSDKFNIGKIVASLGVVSILSISLAQTSFAQESVEKIVKKINLGHIGAVQVESSKVESIKVPEDMSGKVFDKDGKPVKFLTEKNINNLYTADGKPLKITPKEDKENKKNTLKIKDANEINKYTCFKVMLPNYLPDGYKFDRAEFIKKDGTVKDSKFVDLFFVNEKAGKEIYMQQRAAEKDMKYFSGTDGKIEKVKVNGIDAILSDDRCIDWETKDVLYGLSGKGNISKSELIKIAESIK